MTELITEDKDPVGEAEPCHTVRAVVTGIQYQVFVNGTRTLGQEWIAVAIKKEDFIPGAFVYRWLADAWIMSDGIRD